MISFFDLNNINIKVLIFLTVLIVSLFSEKQYYQINSIIILSNKRTKNHIIMNEMEFDKKIIYEKSVLILNLSNSLQNLKNLDIFFNADLILQNEPSQEISNFEINTNLEYKSAAIIAEDRWTLFPIILPEYDSKAGYLIEVMLIDQNFLGLNHDIELSAEYGSLRKMLFLNYYYKRLMGSRYFLRSETSYDNYNDFIYNSSVDLLSGEKIAYHTETIFFKQYVEFGKIFKRENNDFSWAAIAEIESVKNNVLINKINKLPENFNEIKIGPCFKQGKLNKDNYLTWGHENRIYTAFLLRSKNIFSEIKQIRYFKYNKKSFVGYRITGFYNPAYEISLNSIENIRGIDPGYVRGYYGAYANFEIKNYMFRFRFLTDFLFYSILFFDTGNAFNAVENFTMKETVYTAGIGGRFFPVKIGGTAIRFDVGIDINKLHLISKQKEMIFFTLAFQEMF